MKKGSHDQRRIPPTNSLKRYDWSKAARGRYAARFPRDAHAVVINPELWPYFGSSDAVNEGLRTLVEVVKLASKVGAGKAASTAPGMASARSERVSAHPRARTAPDQITRFTPTP